MTKFDEVRYRNCPWCGTKNVAMNTEWSDRYVRTPSVTRSWAALTCPRCAGAVLLELMVLPDSTTGTEIADYAEVVELNVIPSDGGALRTVKHLPENVQRFYDDAQRVLDAGVPDAAAVQLRKTLEAAAAHRNVKEKSLYASVEKLIENGYITKDFSKLLDHVRKIGNLGAHYNDEKIDVDEVNRAMRFTTQVLRNLFEVPGELDELDSPKEPLEEKAPAGYVVGMAIGSETAGGAP